MTPTIPESIRLILVGGKGGVGKSTVSCALACALSERGPTHLLSVDPAHSIGDVLNGEIPARLTVEALDADRLLEHFRRETAGPLAEITLRGTLLKAEHVRAALAQGVPGHDELMAMLHIDVLLADPTGPTLVVDTAPTGHTLRLLDTPDLLSQWVDALDAVLEKHRYLRARFGGDDAPDHLDHFLDRYRNCASRLDTILHDPARCAFWVVTLDEVVVADETAALERALDARAIPRLPTLLNRAIRAGEGPRLPVVVPEPRGARALLRLWNTPCSTPDISPSVCEDMEVSEPFPEPVIDRPWLWLVGKGGVGKTTLACAVALGLAERSPERAILLLSTDPAHSLAAALGRPVGAEPTPVYAGLYAMALDPAAELASIKARHREDVRALFGATLAAGFDPTFDRAVLERLFDLAPPGIDEIMALARAARLAGEGRWGQIVVDTAPTGHFLRLLALPEVLDAWLKWTFTVLLDHPEVKLPGLTAELVTRSRELKRFRSLFADGGSSSVIVVDRPGEVVGAETRTLIADARAAGAAPALHVLNCAVVAPMVPTHDLPFVAVHRGAPPVGLGPLRALGRALAPPKAKREAG